MSEEQTRAAFEAAMLRRYGQALDYRRLRNGEYVERSVNDKFGIFKLGLAHRQPSAYCPDCGKRNSADGVHTCSPQARGEVENAEDCVEFEIRLGEQIFNQVRERISDLDAADRRDAARYVAIIPLIVEKCGLEAANAMLAQADSIIAEREGKTCAN